MEASKDGTKKNKKVQLNVRFSKIKKRRLKRKAVKSGLNLSEYVGALLFDADGKNSRIRKW